MVELGLFEIEGYDTLPTHRLQVHLLAGALAGIMEHCVMFPIDSVKTRAQSLCPCPERTCKTPVQGLISIVREEGIWRPMRGMNVIATGAIPAHALYFSVYEKLKHFLTGGQPGHHPLKHGIAGAAATLCHDAIMNPAEAACTCLLPIVILICCNYYFTRQDKKKVGKGNFGFPVADWKAYNNQVQNELSKLKKSIEDSDDDEFKNDKSPLNHAESLQDKKNTTEVENNPDWLISSEEIEELPPPLEQLDDPNILESSNSHKQHHVTFSEEISQDEELPPLDSENLSGKLKTLKIRQAAKKAEADMTDEQKHEEAEVRRQQLARIFELMNKQQEKFGVNSVDDVQEQMRLYSL